MLWSKQCKCCQEMATGNTFESKVTGRKYHIRNNISWKIKKSHIAQVVCWKEGECAAHQNEWHHSDTKTRKAEKPVAANFCQLDYTMKDLQVREIEKIHRSSTQSWRERERASGSSPSECCLHMGWIWISDVTAYVTVYAITVYPALVSNKSLGMRLCHFIGKGIKLQI